MRTAVLILFAGYLVGAAVFAESQSVSDSVLQHHANAARTGTFVVPSLTWERAPAVHLDQSFHADVEGDVYAQPLYWHPAGSKQALLLVATERNFVYALDASTGAPIWKASLGKPVRREALPCGNIDPLGITGTPVIDERSQALYVGSLVEVPGERAPKHRIFALSLKDGSTLPGWPIDVETALRGHETAFQSAVQNQRGALTVVGDSVYVPYGGHFGDCGDYHG